MISRVNLQPYLMAAWQDSDLVKIGLIQSYAYHRALYDEHAMLCQFIATHQGNTSVRVLWSKTLERVQTDLECAYWLNQKLKSVGVSSSAPYGLISNKMCEVLEGAYDLLSDPNEFKSMLGASFAEPWLDAPPFPVLLGDSKTGYGTSNITYANAALTEIALTLIGDESTIDCLSLSGSHWIDESSFVHVVPMPKAFYVDSGFQSSSFAYSDSQTPYGMAYIHTGYTFGGTRGEVRYKDGPLFGPMDCTSWLSDLSGCTYEFTTLDLLYTYRTLLGEGGYVDPSWSKNKCAKEWLHHFAPVVVEDPWSDIHPGQILFFRNFKESQHQQSVGYGGHAALVLGVTDDAQVITLNYARNMPTEGFGISLYPCQSSAKKEVMFLEVVGTPLSFDDVFSDYSSTSSQSEFQTLEWFPPPQQFMHEGLLSGFPFEVTV